MFLLPSSFLKVIQTKNKGRGVFARSEISPGLIVGDYVGRVVLTEDIEDPSEDLNIWRNDQESICPDPEEPGVHLINHSCMPNCAFFPYHGHTIVTALRRIFVGEELNVGYVIEPPERGTKEIVRECYCGSTLCKGTMYASRSLSEVFWDFEVKMQGDYLKKRLVRRGEILPPLPKYPKTIKDHSIYSIYGSESVKPAKILSKVFPKRSDVRKHIRESGRSLIFPHFGMKVLGVQEKRMIIEAS